MTSSSSSSKLQVMEKPRPRLLIGTTCADVNQAVHELLAEGKVRCKPGSERKLEKLIGKISPHEARKRYREMALELNGQYGGKTEPETINEALDNIVELRKANVEMSRLTRLIKGIPD